MKKKCIDTFVLAAAAALGLIGETGADEMQLSYITKPTVFLSTPIIPENDRADWICRTALVTCRKRLSWGLGTSCMCCGYYRCYPGI